LAEPAKKLDAPLLDANPAIPGLVWAFRLHSDGSAEPLPIDAPIEFSHDGRLWLHFNLADARARSWLTASHIPQLARELLLSHDNFQQLHTIDNCVYGVFSDLVRDIDAATEETGFLRFAMTERLLISGRHQALCAVDATRRVLEGGHRVETVAALLEKIIDEVADTMDRVADKIGAEIDSIEERILAGEIKSEMRSALGRSRRTSVRLHRQLAGLRTLFHRLEHKRLAPGAGRRRLSVQPDLYQGGSECSNSGSWSQRPSVSFGFRGPGGGCRGAVRCFGRPTAG
jgi:zinc transporter